MCGEADKSLFSRKSIGCNSKDGFVFAYPRTAGTDQSTLHIQNPPLQAFWVYRPCNVRPWSSSHLQSEFQKKHMLPVVWQTIQKNAWLGKWFNWSERLRRLSIQQAGKALNTHSASFSIWLTMYLTHIPPPAAPISDMIFVSCEIYTEARIFILYCPRVPRCLPQNFIRPILSFTLFQNFTPLFPAMQGRCKH